jgi:hypothetical protein
MPDAVRQEIASVHASEYNPDDELLAGESMCRCAFEEATR